MKARIVVLSVLLAGAASFVRPAPALAQDGRPIQTPVEQTGRESRLIDSYGRLGHCDWTARLDNFAVELQNNPGAKGYVVSYSSPERHAYAPSQLKHSRYYLTETRGLDPARFVLVEGGIREGLKGGLTELWFVPEGAEPPVAPPANDKYAGNFSGKFDSYAADLNVYQEMFEMGTPASDISRAEFAAKLKQQPDSVGYLVIRTPRETAPGAWLRIARRDEQLLKAHGVEASRLKSLDGGQSESREGEVEFWVLPQGAPPPAPAPGKVEWSLTSAAKLHTFESYGEGDENTERWMLENLAEFLRENPRASAWLVAREPVPSEEPGGEEGMAAEGMVETAEPQETPVEAEPSDESAVPDDEPPTMKELAEEWKAQLVGKHGVAPHRVLVFDGRAIRWGGGRLNIWVVPEKGARPDPSAPDEDEAEQERLHGVDDEGGNKGEAQPTPPTR